MLITYEDLDSQEVHGKALVDYLVSVEATLLISVDAVVIYQESNFPVVELARSLRTWLSDPDRGDFEFDSMSFEEVGSVFIRKAGPRWVVGSVFLPSVLSSPLLWAEIQRSVAAFVRMVEGGLAGLGVDPREVLGP